MKKFIDKFLVLFLGMPIALITLLLLIFVDGFKIICDKLAVILEELGFKRTAGVIKSITNRLEIEL